MVDIITTISVLLNVNDLNALFKRQIVRVDQKTILIIQDIQIYSSVVICENPTLTYMDIYLPQCSKIPQKLTQGPPCGPRLGARYKQGPIVPHWFPTSHHGSGGV